jgi:hypothetical protein
VGGRGVCHFRNVLFRCDVFKVERGYVEGRELELGPGTGDWWTKMESGQLPFVFSATLGSTFTYSYVLYGVYTPTHPYIDTTDTWGGQECLMRWASSDVRLVNVRLWLLGVEGFPRKDSLSHSMDELMDGQF